MSQSRLIPLTYYDPGKEVRLTVYADTIILDRSGEGSVISAVRFGGMRGAAVLRSNSSKSRSLSPAGTKM
mgnify:CR=1 FL=1